VTGTVISGNSALYGGGVDSSGALVMVGCSVRGNSAVSRDGSPNAGQGGGLSVYGGISTLTSCTVTGNSAAVNGGGIFINRPSTLNLGGCAITGNQAGAQGGGIANDGDVQMALTLISGNSATLGGGLYDRGTATLILCDVELNSASAGGGIYVDPAGSPVALLGTTVRRNKGGDIFGPVA
jgi:hypothetical protein